MRAVAVLFLTLSGWGLAAECPTRVLEPLLVRKAVVKWEPIREAMQALTDDPLIQELEAIHIREVQEEMRYSLEKASSGAIVSRPDFDLTWLLSPRYKKEFQGVVDHFVGLHSERVEGPAQWVRRWEQAFVAGGGALSSAWTQKTAKKESARRRFIEKLICEIAYRYQRSHGVDGQPRRWDASSEFQEFYVNILANEFVADLETFQTLYDNYHRQRAGTKTPAVAHRYRKVRKSLRQILAGAGISNKVLKSWKPSRDAWEKARGQASAVDLLIESIDTFGSSQLPLAGLFLQVSTGAEVQVAFEWTMANGLADSLGTSLHQVLAKVADRRSDLKMSGGLENWIQELIVQGAVLYEMETGEELQVLKPELPHYLDRQMILWRLSRITKRAFDSAVAARRQELGLVQIPDEGQK